MPKPNFADPDWEPSDDDLRALAHEAFASIGERFQAELARRRAQTQALRAKLMLDLAARLAPPST